MTGPGAKVSAVGVLTGWGEGIAALPDDALAAAGGREVVPIATPVLAGERFRRVTRECLLGIAAVEAALGAAGLSRDVVRGEGTALYYATAGAYGASNRASIEAATSGALHFPYTAPSAVPAEAAIEFGLTGSYVILIGGATATLEALWQASNLLERGGARRALVLSVETFVECADLYARGRRLLGRPLVEAAACAVLEPGLRRPSWTVAGAAGVALESAVTRRAGETLACAPLIGLALAGDAGGGAPVTVTGRWRGREAGLTWAGQDSG